MENNSKNSMDILWKNCGFKAPSHDAIATAICSVQPKGCKGFHVIAAIAPCEHFTLNSTRFICCEEKSQSQLHRCEQPFKIGRKKCYISVVCHSCIVRHLEPLTPILVLFVHCSLPNLSQIKSNHFLKLDHNYSSTTKDDFILCPFYLSYSKVF